MTEHQKKVLAIIAARQRQAGPSLREVAQILDVYPNAVQTTVRLLREQGHLAPDSGNGLVVTNPKRP